MAETKEKKEAVKNTPASSTPDKSTQPKKKSNTIWYIIGGVVLLLILLPIIGFFVFKGLVKKGVDSLEDAVDEYEEIVEEEDYDIGTSDEAQEEEETALYKKPTEESVDGQLEKADLVNKNFPEDIPLSGGIVTASSYDSDYSVDVKIDIDSTVDETLDWYENAFEEIDWVITERSSSEDVEGWFSGRLGAETEDGERNVKVNLDRNPYQDFTSITVTEYLY